MKKMIIETVITSLDENSKIHFAALGVEFFKQKIVFYPYQGSKTLENIINSKEGVINIVDKAEYLIKAALGDYHFSVNKIKDDNHYYLEDSCHYYKFRLISVSEIDDKYKVSGKIVLDQSNREYFGLNRANNLLLEAAVKASRIGIKNTCKEVDTFLDNNRRVILKTGDENAEYLFNFLKKYINDLGGNQIDRN
jgi:hypothetical protein